jgi:hypothetical protein
MPKLKNLRLGVYDVPGHGKLRKGQAADVSSSVLASGRIASLISRGKLAIVRDDKEVLMPLPRVKPPVDVSEADTQPAEEVQPPVPTDPPVPEPEPEPEVIEEAKPIIKKRRGRRKKAEDSSEA